MQIQYSNICANETGRARRRGGDQQPPTEATPCTIIVHLWLALHPDCAHGHDIVERDLNDSLSFGLTTNYVGLAQNLQHPRHGTRTQGANTHHMQASDAEIDDSPRETEAQSHDALCRRFGGRLRVIAKQSVTYWFNQDRLDRLLAQYIGSLEGCELIYAIDQGGRQVSSNIFSTSIDTVAYGQDLSRRPYAVSLTVLRNVALQGAFACDAYVSQATRRPCITVMHGVTSGSSLMGFIAADFYPTTVSPGTERIG